MKFIFSFLFVSINLIAYGQVNIDSVNAQNMNDIVAEANIIAAEKINKLQILYNVATDPTQLMSDRLKSVQTLKKIFPEYFGYVNTKLILSGQALVKFKEQKAEIIKDSRAEVVLEKLNDIERQKLDLEFQKQKINTAAANEMNAVMNGKSIEGYVDSITLHYNLDSLFHVIKSDKIYHVTRVDITSDYGTINIKVKDLKKLGMNNYFDKNKLLFTYNIPGRS
jgi:hypothetical protein